MLLTLYIYYPPNVMHNIYLNVNTYDWILNLLTSVDGITTTSTEIPHLMCTQVK